MEKLLEFKLPSGAKLEMNVAPFDESNALFEAVLEEAKSFNINAQTDVDADLWRKIFIYCFSSKRVGAALEPCLKRALYNGAKIIKDTWEPVEARADYVPACIHVARENVWPFMKGLFAESSVLSKATSTDHAQRPETTTS